MLWSFDIRISERTNPRSYQKREFDEIDRLNMDSKPDKECEKRGGIALLSEIISNFSYWQDYETLDSSNLGLIQRLS